MTHGAAALKGRRRAGLRQLLPDIHLGLQNLLLRKLRSLLTMLGMIFGVAAVVSMLSIGAGAQQQVMAFIEQLGVRNLIVEAREASDWQELRNVRKLSPGLTFQDLRIIRSGAAGLAGSSARKRFTPSSMIPKPQREIPVVCGVEPVFQQIADLRVTDGRFFDREENDRAVPVCLLGEGALDNLFPGEDGLGKQVKINEQWLHVIGVLGSRLTLQSDVVGLPAQDMNNVIYAPVNSVIYRLEDQRSGLKDEIDGIYLQLGSAAETISTAEVVRSALHATHRNVGDFSMIVPAELLAEQQRTRRIFEMVMVAIASISLLVGGIGIMNIMLAGVLERTHEIGIRRAVGARKLDIIRQFVIEAVMISVAGGLIGIVSGSGMSRLIAWFAGWSTIVTANSILLAFVVSVSVGLVFGIYPAIQAAKLDPVEAIRYE
ncbi:MAG: ABC transporter permease [Acidobacteriota bacterium]